MKFKTAGAIAALSLFMSVSANGGQLKNTFSGGNEHITPETKGTEQGVNVTDNAGQDASASNSGEASDSSMNNATNSTDPTPTQLPASTESSSETPAESAATSTSKEAATKEIVGDPIVIRIGRTEFRRSQILADMKKIPAQLIQGLSPDKLFVLLRDQKLHSYLMSEQAKKAQIDRQPAFIARLNQIKEEMMIREFLNRELTPKTQNEAALKARYTKYLVEFKKQKETQVFHMMVATENEAKDIIARLQKKEDFAKIAKEKSLSPSKDKGGDEGWMPLDIFPEQLKKPLIALKEGEFTKTPIELEKTWHVFKVGKTRDSSPLKYEDAKDMLRQLIMQEELRSLMQRLMKQSGAQLFNEDGSPVTAADLHAAAANAS